jgi:hypothetical protein
VPGDFIRLFRRLTSKFQLPPLTPWTTFLYVQNHLRPFPHSRIIIFVILEVCPYFQSEKLSLAKAAGHHDSQEVGALAPTFSRGSRCPVPIARALSVDARPQTPQRATDPARRRLPGEGTAPNLVQLSHVYIILVNNMPPQISQFFDKLDLNGPLDFDICFFRSFFRRCAKSPVSMHVFARAKIFRVAQIGFDAFLNGHLYH